MAACRPQWWMRMYDSLKGNKCNWEIVACGQNPPKFRLPKNFKYIYSPFKPCQAYQTAALQCSGEFIGWGTDDSSFNSDSLDKICDAIDVSKKIIYAQQSIEDGKDTRNDHFFFWGCPDTPRMAPLAFLKKEWFFSLGAYDRNFICGQSENDVVLRALQDGGEVRLISESKVYIHHKQVHRFIWNYPFRSGYNTDRRYLEECWVKEGFGTYDEKTLKHGTVSLVRLLAHHPFNYDNILNVPQGNQGRWSKYAKT